MRMRNPAQMKGLVKNVAAGLGVPANVALHMYVMERFIDRISRSEYKDRFVLKGGFLLYSIKGMDRRTTEDLDMTSKTLDVTEDELTPVIRRICEIDADDDFVMEIVKVETVAELLEHPGLRYFIDATYGVKERFYIDIVPSPQIVPEEVNHDIVPMFGDKPISIMAYRLETVIAEKLHAALTRADENTRMRDYYDFYVLDHDGGFDDDVLTKATEYAFESRGTVNSLNDWENILEHIRGSHTMNTLWLAYQKGHVYAGSISFEDASDSAEHLLTTIDSRRTVNPKNDEAL